MLIATNQICLEVCLLCGLENMSQSGQWIEVIGGQRDQSTAGDH